MNKPEALFSEIYRQYCWGVDWDSQLNLSIHFGEPWLSVWGPLHRKPHKRFVRPKGRWWLRVWLSYWKLSLADGISVTGASAHRQKVLAMSLLEGQALTEIAVDLDRGRTRLTFDLGGVLELRAMTVGSADELWSLHRPRNYVLSVFGDGRFSHRRQPRVGRNLLRRRITSGSSGARAADPVVSPDIVVPAAEPGIRWRKSR